MYPLPPALTRRIQALESELGYHLNLETIPLFQEPMVLLTNTSSSYPDVVSPTILA